MRLMVKGLTHFSFSWSLEDGVGVVAYGIAGLLFALTFPWARAFPRAPLLRYRAEGGPKTLTDSRIVRSNANIAR